MALSCYIHVPFCRKLCTYCDFYKMVHDPEWENRYIEAICKEIELRMVTQDRPHLDSLYIGGGTPTVLSEESWRQLTETIRTAFELPPGTEKTVEANPESATPWKLELLWAIGFNRISLGAQSFQEKNLKRLGRIHQAAQIGGAVRQARHIGFTNISLDLMYGLPDETDASLDDDIRQVIELEPQHISFYSLMLEGDVPLKRQVEKREVPLPDDDAVADRYVRAIEAFTAAGYKHYEISNFARPGNECRHSLSYWTHDDYYAFGPAAVGTIGEERYRNEADLKGYVEKLERGNLPPHDVEQLNDGKRLLETIMLRLRMKEGLDYEVLKNRYDFDILEVRNDLLGALAADGDIEITDSRIRLTPQGMFRSDLITSALLPDWV